MARVAFYAGLTFHGPILAPIQAALGDRVESLRTEDRRAVVAFAPHVLVMAALDSLEFFRYHLPHTFVVSVRHGLVGKRGLDRLPRRASARVLDAVCVGDPIRKARYERARARPAEFWETGYPQIDPLFRRDPPPPLSGDPGRPTVLYAPTWNLGLTSAVMLGDRLVDLVRAGSPRANIIIKPHPVIGDWRSAWMARWRRLARAHAGVHLVEATHADVMPYMLASDVLVSDASSVIFEFLALDRPIVLITNPRHAADPAWAPDDIVWRWRDVGHEIHDIGDLPAAVAAAVRTPEARGDIRRAYARTLFGSFTDGRSARRIADKVLETSLRIERDGHRAPARPTRIEFLWHDLRTVLRHSTSFRRLLMAPLEGIRLAVRRGEVGSRAAASPTSAGKDP